MTNERKLLLKCVTDPKALQSQWGQIVYDIELGIIFIKLCFHKIFCIAFKHPSYGTLDKYLNYCNCVHNINIQMRLEKYFDPIIRDTSRT